MGAVTLNEMLCFALPLVSWVLKTVVSALMFQAYRLSKVVPLLISDCVEFRQSPSPLPPPLQVAPDALLVAPDICAAARPAGPRITANAHSVSAFRVRRTLARLMTPPRWTPTSRCGGWLARGRW